MGERTVARAQRRRSAQSSFCHLIRQRVLVAGRRQLRTRGRSCTSETRPGCENRVRARSTDSRTSDRGSLPSPRAGSSSTCATPSGGPRRAGARGAPSRASTATRRSSLPSSGSTSPSWTRTDRPLPRRVEPGGVPRPFRGVRATRRGRGTTPGALDIFHSPPWTEHAFVGAGDGPCVILMVGARST